MLSKSYSYLIIGLGLTILVVFLACSKAEQETKNYEAASAETETMMEVAVWNKVCPICGDEVDPKTETVTYDGKVYGFGCAACPEKFSKDPAKSVKNLSEDGAEFIGG